MAAAKLLHEIKDQVSGGWQTKSVGTLVNRIHNNEDWAVVGQCERLLQALYQYIVGGLLCTVVVNQVYAVENIAAKIGASRELRKKRKY